MNEKLKPCILYCHVSLESLFIAMANQHLFLEGQPIKKKYFSFVIHGSSEFVICGEDSMVSIILKKTRQLQPRYLGRSCRVVGWGINGRWRGIWSPAGAQG
jgi:hypothetical protein